MEFGKHIGKGVWAFADKSLPAFYGIAYIFLVVRVLPEQEFGAWGIIWSVFLLFSTFCFTLAFQPLTKFAAEHEHYGRFVSASLFVGFFFYLIISGALLAFKGPLIALLDPKKTPMLADLWNFIPLLLFGSLMRTMTLGLLQARYAVQKIFWIDSVYFLGTVAMILVAKQLHHFSTANDLVVLNLIGSCASSLLALILIYPSLPKSLTFRSADVKELLQFGKYLFGSNAIYTIFAQLDVFFVSSYVGIAGVAIYNVAKIFNRLFDMLGQVLQLFLLPFSAKTYAQGDHEKLLTTAEKAICFSTLIMLPVFLAMLLVPHEMLQILYKGRYQEAAPLIRVFSLLALITPWNGVISTYFVGYGKAKDGFYLGFILLALATASYKILTPLYGILGASIGYVTTLFLITVVIWYYLRKELPLTLFNVILRTKDALEFVKKKAIGKS